jgi:hypothetical protein
MVNNSTHLYSMGDNITHSIMAAELTLSDIGVGRRLLTLQVFARPPNCCVGDVVSHMDAGLLSLSFGIRVRKLMPHVCTVAAHEFAYNHARLHCSMVAVTHVLLVINNKSI